MSFSTNEGANSATVNPLGWTRGATSRQGKEREKRRKGGKNERKERDGRDTRKHHRINFWLQRCMHSSSCFKLDQYSVFSSHPVRVTIAYQH